MSEALEAARRLVGQADESARHADPRHAENTRPLRDSVRALIQEAEQQDERLTRLESRTGLIA